MVLADLRKMFVAKQSFLDLCDVSKRIDKNCNVLKKVIEGVNLSLEIYRKLHSSRHKILNERIKDLEAKVHDLRAEHVKRYEISDKDSIQEFLAFTSNPVEGKGCTEIPVSKPPCFGYCNAEACDECKDIKMCDSIECPTCLFEPECSSVAGLKC